MFGSLRISDCRLDAGERELYRGQFCGSCHAMREFSGRASSLLTNYDQTVLALVLGGLERTSEVDWRPCTAVPFRKVPVVPLSAGSREYLAALNLALVHAKLIDDRDDETLGRRWLARGGLHLIRDRARSGIDALRRVRFPVEQILDLPKRQARAESSAGPSLASLAAPSAELTGTLFAIAAGVASRPDLRESLRRFGHALGAFVYVEDARQDRMMDRMRGRFNAIDACHGRVAGGAESLRFQGEQLAALEAELSALDLGVQRSVLRHLLGTLQGRLSTQARSREAGDCDCGGCDCCTPSCSCETGCNPCDAGGGGGPCGCCDTACTPIDCLVWNSEKRADRREKRKLRFMELRERRRAKKAAETVPPSASLLGARGTTVTQLRPQGAVDFDGERVDVRTRGEYLDVGVRVAVVEVSADRVIVTADTERATKTGLDERSGG